MQNFGQDTCREEKTLKRGGQYYDGPYIRKVSRCGLNSTGSDGCDQCWALVNTVMNLWIP